MYAYMCIVARRSSNAPSTFILISNSPQGEKIVLFNRLDLHHTTPDSGKRQYKSRTPAGRFDHALRACGWSRWHTRFLPVINNLLPLTLKSFEEVEIDFPCERQKKYRKKYSIRWSPDVKNWITNRGGSDDRLTGEVSKKCLPGEIPFCGLPPLKRPGFWACPLWRQDGSSRHRPAVVYHRVYFRIRC